MWRKYKVGKSILYGWNFHKIMKETRKIKKYKFGLRTNFWWR